MNIRQRVAWGVAPVIVVFIGILCLRVGATTMKAYSMEDLVAESDVVVIGRATKIEHHKNERGKLVRSVTFNVDEYVVGRGPSRIVLQLAGGTIGNIRTRVFGEVNLKVHEDVLLFVKEAQSTREPAYSIVGMRQGRFVILKDEQTGMRFISQMVVGLNLVDEVGDDPMGIGRGNVCIFVSLDRFMVRIRQIQGVTEAAAGE